MVPFSAYEALVKELAAMKREGFVPGISGEVPQPAPDVPEVIRKAITALGVDKGTERHLVGQAWELLRAGEDETAVAQKISDGEEVQL